MKQKKYCLLIKIVNVLLILGIFVNSISFFPIYAFIKNKEELNNNYLDNDKEVSYLYESEYNQNDYIRKFIEMMELKNIIFI